MLIIHVIGCLLLIGIVLMQTGKGGLGSALGGDSEQFFGGRGAAPFMTRATTILAVLFMLTSLSLSFVSGRQTRAKSAIEKAVQQGQPVQSAPVQEPAPQGQPAQQPFPAGGK
jgi:preprotein translocase subunit SecG